MNFSYMYLCQKQCCIDQYFVWFEGKVGNNLDRHENIGKGQIGTEGFQRIMNDSRLNGIPMILETPCPDDDMYEKEVKILYSLCK